MAQLQPEHRSALQRLGRRGPFRARDLQACGLPRTCLLRACREGFLERIARGMYRLSTGHHSSWSTLAEVRVRVPRATICLLSALRFHGLSTQSPAEVWVMVDRHARRPRTDLVDLRVIRASGNARAHGIERHRIDGTWVEITSAAKTVADCFRYERHVGRETALAALKDFLQQHPHRVTQLLHAAKASRVEKRLRPLVEALL